MQQAREHTRFMAVMIVVVMIVVVMPRVVTVARPVVVLVLVSGSLIIVVTVTVVRAARVAHDIQHARENALQHIDKYRARAVAS